MRSGFETSYHKLAKEARKKGAQANDFVVEAPPPPSPHLAHPKTQFSPNDHGLLPPSSNASRCTNCPSVDSARSASSLISVDCLTLGPSTSSNSKHGNRALHSLSLSLPGLIFYLPARPAGLFAFGESCVRCASGGFDFFL